MHCKCGRFMSKAGSNKQGTMYSCKCGIKRTRSKWNTVICTWCPQKATR